MKKSLFILNEYLSHFWFFILLLALSGLTLIFFVPLPQIISLGQNRILSSLALFIWYSLTFYFLPLAILSAAISIFVWLKGDATHTRRGLISLIIIILSVASIFLLTLKLSSTETKILSGTISIPVIGGPSQVIAN
ncbi:MAG: hypothetical protein WC467_01385 [Patescibacteria group bacterium]